MNLERDRVIMRRQKEDLVEEISRRPEAGSRGAILYESNVGFGKLSTEMDRWKY